jgi:cell wall-associated NlpC family hydrolase
VSRLKSWTSWSLVFTSVLCIECFALDPVDIAANQIGKPYVWGAVGPDSFDCSGLTLYAFQQTGVTIPRTSLAQSTFGTQVVGSLQRDDLLFFSTDDERPGVVTHVGVYEGSNIMIDANSYSNRVTRDDISISYWSTRFLFCPPSLTHLNCVV